MQKKRIAFLGPTGTVSEEATRYFFQDDDHHLIPYRYIADVFSATANGETDFSVIPIENTIDGSVSLHMDWLVHEVDLPIRAEWTYPSVQNLIGFKNNEDDSSLSHIRKILSHPVAMAQCKQFLNRELPTVETDHVSSTAESVRIVKESEDRSIAAIGTKLAAQLYGLDILAPHIQDHDNNFTRFILIGNGELELKKKSEMMKTTIIVTLPEDYPGALHQVLSAFSWRRINLSRIESRPTKKRLGSYYFYIDIEASLDSVLLPAAIAEIEAIGSQVRLLGSYPTYSYNEANAEV